MECGPIKGGQDPGPLPQMTFMKFNVDRTATYNPRPAGNGGVLDDNKGRLMFMFPERVRVKDYNEANKANRRFEDLLILIA